jgi:hypothetical protein
MRARCLAVFVIIAALTAACAPAVVVNTGETPPRTETPAPPSPTGRFDPNLVDAHDYYVSAGGVKGYYFTTPSGKWSRDLAAFAGGLPGGCRCDECSRRT